MASDLQRPAIGALAPPIELTTLAGATWRLGDMRGRPVVVVFHRHIH